MEEKMSNILIINIWKKGTNKYTSEADYHIEVDPREIDYVWNLVSALKEIAKGLNKDS
jgi:hypothetical protein